MRRRYSLCKKSSLRKTAIIIAGLLSFSIKSFSGNLPYGADSSAVCEEELKAPAEIAAACGTTIITPGNGNVCSSASITTTFSIAGFTGCDFAYWISYNGGAFTGPWITSAPIIISTVGWTTVAVRAQAISCTTPACSGGAPPITTVNWTVQAQPVAPTITPNPNTSTVCVGKTLTVAVVAGSGPGADQYRSKAGAGAWSGWGGIPSFGAAVGKDSIQSRRYTTQVGCVVPVNSVEWTAVTASVAPTLLVKTPNVATICQGINVNATFNPGSGGTGCRDSFDYQYNGGANPYFNYASGDPISTTGNTSLIIRRGRICNNTALTGCATTAQASAVSWNPMGTQPVARTITPSPNAPSVCVGQALTVATAGGSGGVGTIKDDYRTSTDGGVTWSAWSTTVPNFTSVVLGTTYIQNVRSANGVGCDSSTKNQVSWNVVAKPVNPVQTKVPNIPAVCAGQTLTSTAIAGTGGCGTVQDEYRYSTNNGGLWTAWAAGPIPSFLAVTSTNNFIQARRTATGPSCTTPAANQVAWTVNNQPTKPVLGSKNPNVATVCDGQSVNAAITAGTGGTGCADQYQFEWDGNGTWNGYTSGTGLVTTGHTKVRIRVTRTGCTAGAGCLSFGLDTIATWDVVPKPVSPLLTKNPNVTNVCAGQILTVDTISGTGGTGVIQDQFRYSTNNGGVWSVWNSTIPNFAAVTSTNNFIQSRRTATGPGCTTSASNQIAWTVLALPVAKTFTKSPNVPTTCDGQILKATPGGGAGGTGTIVDEYRVSTDNGTNWSTWATPIPNPVNVSAVIGTTIVQSRRTADGLGCTTGTNQVTWDVVPMPVAPTVDVQTPNLTTVCDGALLNSTFNPGSGGVNYRDSFQYRLGSGAWTPYVPGTDLNSAGFTSVTIRVQRYGSISGCASTTWSPIVQWAVTSQPTAPTASAVSPNTPIVCEGQIAYALFNPGGGGVGSCLDQYQYSYDGSGTWVNYTAGTNITTTGHTQIELQSRRGGCNAGAQCVSTLWTNVYTWTISKQPTSPTLNSITPFSDSVCSGQNVSATFNPGTGGSGCTDMFSYRYDNTGAWVNYTPGNNILTTGHTSLQIRGQRTNCIPSSGCLSSLWSNLANLRITPQPTSPTLNVKTPNILTICDGQNVSATFLSGGGGVGCSDQFQYSFDSVTWFPYTPGNTINSAGNTRVIIQGSRGGCRAGAGCSGTVWTTLAYWLVNPQPTSPTLNVKTPDLTAVCNGQNVSATFNSGAGGVGCSDQYRYRYDGGAWFTYTSGAAINTGGHNSVDIQGQRFNCNPSAGCTSSSWDSLASWSIALQPTGPSLNVKTPNVSSVCLGENVSATFNPGIGGAGCTDQFQYRFDNTGAWLPYTPGNNISTAGHALVEIQGQRNNCPSGSGCASTPWNTLASWNVVALPVGPTLSTKSPDVSNVCEGVLISAFFAAGSGGIGCTDQFQYRYDGGGSWFLYSPGSNILTTGHTLVEIQGQRSGCLASTGCIGTPWVTLSTWTIQPQPVSPSLNTKIPNLVSVCEGQNVSAIINAGSGGNGCRDSLQYRYDGSGAWTPYVSGQIIATAGHFSVTIVGQRGNCTGGSGCNATSWQEIANWDIRPHPTSPSINQKIPNLPSVCDGMGVSATFNPGSGGVGCTEQYQFRYDGAGAWAPYVPGNNITTTGHTLVEIQSQQTACDPAAGCTLPGWSTVASWTVESQPTAPTINTLVPNMPSVCSGQDVSATFNAGTGGVGCTDQFQYRYDGTGIWLSYVPGTNIVTIGHTLVEIQSRRSGCAGLAGCMGTAWTPVASWIIAAQPSSPTINTKTPNLSNICEGQNASAIFNTGSGGVGCTDQFQYRFDNTGAWTAYTPGNNINTTGHSSLEIQGQRAGCNAGSGCNSSAWVSLADWNIQAQPVLPSVYSLTPNLPGVCAGQPVSAFFNAGSGGTGCTDQFRYSYDGSGTWFAYTPGTNINTTGHNLVEVQAQRSGCAASAGCTGVPWTTLVTWTVALQPAVPTVNTKTPNLASVCEGQDVSAIFNVGVGGVGCSDNFEYRFDGIGFWTSYVPGTSLSSTGHTKIEIQGQRSGCSVGTGCIGTPWQTLVTWNVLPSPTAPKLNAKLPPLADICEGQNVSATFVAGFGGVGCTDQYQYQYDGSGVWNTYTPGAALPTTGHTSVDIQGQRAGCTVGVSCTGTVWNTLASWNINPQPVNPLAMVPLHDTVCNGELIAASFTAGTGGVGCTDEYQYRFDNTGIWLTYTPGDSLLSSGHSKLTILGTRKCNTVAGCNVNAWDSVGQWDILGKLVGPTLGVKSPNLMDVCEGVSVSATRNLGSGGKDCTDTLEYKYETGSWLPYTAGSPITTSGHTKVEIRGQRTRCSVCSSTPWNIIASWNIHPQPGSPGINDIVPNLPMICQGQEVTATFDPGTNGAGCKDFFQYRMDSTSAVWTNYIPGSAIKTESQTYLEIQGQRAQCSIDAGCTPSEWTSLSKWKIYPQPKYPTVTAIDPNQETICEGIPVKASFDTGTGGVNSVDRYQYRFDNAGAWFSYRPDSQLITTDHTVIQIQALRSGGTQGSGCKGLPWRTLASWGIYLKPEISSVQVDSVCGHGVVTLTVLPNTFASMVNWYDSLTGGTKLDSMINGGSFKTPHLYTTTTYYFDASMKGCVTDVRLPVDAIIFKCDDIVKDSIPNFFSPNGDESNEKWDFDMSNHPNCYVIVYNKWGQEVWRSDRGYTVKWDGTKNGGGKVPDGGYNFVIIEDDKVIKTGGVVILR